jgi:DNA invertase Pin-like site-specific DNA recombinase
MTEIIGIVRVSTEEQRGENDEGLARQYTSLKEIEAKLPGCKMTRVPISDVSGNALHTTPEWRTIILPALKRGAGLAANAMSRIIRADDYDLSVLQSLKAGGGRVYLPGTSYDPRVPSDYLMLMMLAGIGGFDKSIIKMQMGDGKEEARKRGCWVNRINVLPRGTHYTRPTARKGTGTWSTTPEAVQVRAAYEAYAEGASLKSVATMLGLDRSTIPLLLKNTIYKGILTFDQTVGEQYESTDGRQAQRRKVKRTSEKVISVRVFPSDQQIVSDDLWARVQHRLDAVRSSKSKRREETRPDIYLSGHLASSLCCTLPDGLGMLDLSEPVQHVLYGRHSGVRPTGLVRPTYYLCRCRCDPKAKLKLPKCSLGHLRVEMVNAAVDKFLADFTAEPDSMNRIKAMLKGDKPADHAVEKVRLEKAITKADTNLGKLKGLLVQAMAGIEDITESDVRTQIESVKAEKVKAAARLAELNRLPVMPTDDQLDALAKDWAYSPAWEPQVKRAWIARHIGTIFISDDGIESVGLRLPGDCTVSVAMPRPFHGKGTVREKDPNL